MTIALDNHEFATVFPLPSKSDREALKHSLVENGYDDRHPIVTFEGAVLDGRTRLQLCNELGIEPVIVDYTGSRDEARDFVFAENFARRHLTQRQKMATLHLRNYHIPASKQLSDIEIAALCGATSPKISNQLGRLARVNPERAQRVASGEEFAAPAIRDELGEAAEGEKTFKAAESQPIVLSINEKRRRESVAICAERLIMTPRQVANKCADLFVEWAEAQQRETT